MHLHRACRLSGDVGTVVRSMRSGCVCPSICVHAAVVGFTSPTRSDARMKSIDHRTIAYICSEDRVVPSLASIGLDRRAVVDWHASIDCGTRSVIERPARPSSFDSSPTLTLDSHLYRDGCVDYTRTLPSSRNSDIVCTWRRINQQPHPYTCSQPPRCRLPTAPLCTV
jgi:hypothetical protein